MEYCKGFIVLSLFMLTTASWAMKVDCNETKTEFTEQFDIDLSFFTSSLKSCYNSGLSGYDSTMSLSLHYDPFAEFFPDMDHGSTSSAFQAQQEFCNCVAEKEKEKSKRWNMEVGDFDYFSPADEVLKSESFALAHLGKLLDNFNKRAQNTHNMMILHAQSMGKDTAVQYNLNESVSLDKDFTDFVNKTIKGNVKKDIKNFKNNGEDLDANIEKLISLKAMEDQGPTILNILKDGEVDGESCVPMKDYLLINSFPEDNAFWNSITDNFNPVQWNSESLTMHFQYSIDKKEKDLLASKIEFLEKNPLIKLIFNSENKEAAQKVYGIMKKHMGNLKGECSKGLMDGCRGEFTRNKMTSYNNDLKKLFKDPSIVQLVQNERKNAVKKYIESLVTDSNEKLDINTVDRWAVEEFGIDVKTCVSTANLANTFRNSYGQVFNNNLGTGIGIQSLQEHNKITEDKCEREMPRFCQAVGKGSNSLLSMGATAGYSKQEKSNIDDLLNMIAEDMDPNPRTNGNYSRFSDRACREHYRTHGGESVNFEQFKEKKCSRKPDSNICKNKKELYRLFTEGSEDLKRNDEYVDTSIYANYTNTATQVENLSEEDRARFKEIGGSLGHVFGRSFKTKSNGLLDLNDPFSLNKEINIADTLPEATEVSSEPYYEPSVSKSSFVSNYVNNAFQTDYNYALTNAKEVKQELDEEIRNTKEIIAINKERLDRPHTTSKFKNEIESKVKMLETILAEREKTAQEYQEIIAKLIEGKSNVESQQSQALASHQKKNDVHQEEVSKNSSARSGVIASNGAKTEFSEETSRAPASVDSFSTSGGTKGGAASMRPFANSSFSSGASNTRKGAINSALLSKYGITVQESDSSVQVAPDKERSQISQLLMNASKSDVGLEVSKLEFDKFKKYDVNALNELYQKKIEMLDSDVVKLMIHTEGENESLEFYAIKEDGKVVFQPVRKNRLSDLQNALK